MAEWEYARRKAAQSVEEERKDMLCLTLAIDKARYLTANDRLYPYLVLDKSQRDRVAVLILASKLLNLKAVVASSHV